MGSRLPLLHSPSSSSPPSSMVLGEPFRSVFYDNRYTLPRLTILIRMRKPTVMLLPLITTKKPEWVSCMPYTVRVKACGLPCIMLTQRRSWSVLRAVGLNPVLYNEALVLPLLLFTWARGHQCSSGNGDIPFQNTRRRVFSFSLSRERLAELYCRVFAGDWTTPRGGRG